jgi:protein involved in polysaccharide export with SLBB domain
MKKTILLIVLFLVALYAQIAHTQAIQLTPVLQGILNTESQQKQGQDAISPADTEEIKKIIKQPVQEAPPAQAAEAKAEETTSEFERFIAGNMPLEVSTKINQFGYDLFLRPPSTFAPVTSVPVGPDYIIGPEDEIKITVWGKIEGNWAVKVSRDGNITLPKIGVIGIAGLTFEEMKEVIHKEISRYYTGFEMNVSMGALRTIRIYVVGNAQHPGAYTVSSLSTLVSSLFESGGPSKTGTMRDIQLKRSGETLVRFDMYDFLLKGDKTKDLRLLPEDVIFIPPVGPLAGIAGNVKRPAIYELKGEIRLLQLINMAGGLTNTAFKGRVQVQRTEDHKFRTMFEDDLLDMGSNGEKNFLLKDGDLVKVFSVVETNNIVNLAGAVVTQGEYAIKPGTTRIKDIILKAGGVQYYSSNQAELTRITVTQSGPVTEFIEIDISKALADDPEHNILLEINDNLFVRTVPEWNLSQKVTIEGEVKFPGSYTIKKGEPLSSLIKRAGGYTDSAYLRGAVFTRERVRDIQQQSLVQMAARLERELFAEASIKVSTAISAEEIAAKKVEITHKKEFIEALKKIKATGRMTIRLAHLRLLKGSEYDIELENEDNLLIPKKNSVVNVLGAVMSRGSFVYVKDMEYEDFIDMAGGYTKYADKDSVYVLKVDGSAMKLSSGLLNWNQSRNRWDVAGFEDTEEIEPGDSIVVPEKFERIAWLREIKDLTQILYQIAVSAAVVVDIL